MPATAVRLPLLLILKTALPLLKYVLPWVSTVTRFGCPIEVLVAVTGVGGGAPPAAVVNVYCCANAKELPASSQIPHSFPTGLDI